MPTPQEILDNVYEQLVTVRKHPLRKAYKGIFEGQPFVSYTNQGNGYGDGEYYNLILNQQGEAIAVSMNDTELRMGNEYFTDFITFDVEVDETGEEIGLGW